MDSNLNIKRFTPAATQIINLIDADIGRPLRHTVSNSRRGSVRNRQRGLDTLDVIEKEVQSQNGNWYWMQARPYRTLENAVDGVVMTFADINQQKSIQEQLARSEEALRNFYAGMEVAVYVIDVEGDKTFRYTDVNDAFERMTGRPKNTIRGKTLDNMEPAFDPEHIAAEEAAYQQCVDSGQAVEV